MEENKGTKRGTKRRIERRTKRSGTAGSDSQKANAKTSNAQNRNEDGTIFDDVLRTIQERRGKLLIPVVNDAFGAHHPKDAEVTRLPEEFQKVVSKVVADGCSVIENCVYHMEAQSRNDSTMAIRMVEYDFMIGLSMAEKGEEGYTIRLPRSCIIYVRHNEGTPTEEAVSITFQDGQTVKYRVPTLKVQEYTLDELFERGLYAYLPFYLLRYEKDLKRIEGDERRTKALLEECEEILSRLEEALADEPEIFQDLLRLIRRVTGHLLSKRDKLKGKVETVMGGKVLELPSDKLREEREAGRIAGIAEGKVEDILDLLEDLGPVPGKLRESLSAISDIEALRKLHKLAARAGSLEEFEKNALKKR